MINKYQIIYAGANLLAPSEGILLVYALGVGTIKNVRVKVRTANGAGATVFNLSKNGVDQFTTELTIATGQTSVSATGLSIAVAFGDILILKLVSISTGGVIAPIALQFESEETVSFGTDLDAIAALVPSNDDILQRKAGAWTNRTIAQLKTDLSLSNTNSGDETTATIKTKLGISTLSGSNTGDETASSVGALLTGAAAATPNNSDLVATVESSVIKKITWTNVKAFLKTYFDTLYQAVLPSQTGNAGKFLKTDGSALSWDTPSGGGGSYDGGKPSSSLSKFYFRDDFIGGHWGSNAFAMWDCWNSAGSVTAGVSNHPGIIGVGNSTINTVAALSLDKYNNNTPQILCSNASQTFEVGWVFKVIGTLNQMNIRCGLAYDNTNIAPAHGIYIEKLAADTTFFGVTRASSTQSRTSAMNTVAQSTWYYVRVRRIDATTVGFTINGGTEITATTNIPTNALNPFIHIYSSDAVLKQVDVDFFEMEITGLTRY